MTERHAFRVALVIAILAFWLIHFVSFPGSVPYFLKVSGGIPLFDTNIAQSSSDVFDRLEQFGEAGRKEYVFRNLTTDMLLPLSLLPILLLGTQRLKRRFALKSAARVLFILPIAYVALDVIENLSVIFLISARPDRHELIATALPVVTIVKRAAVMTSLLALFTGFLIAVASKVLHLQLKPK